MSKHTQLKRKIIVVGVDGATWKIIDPLVKRGNLPNLERIIKNGTRAKLRSMKPLLTPIIWTTIATGKAPTKHGITGFFNSSSDVTAKRIWEILEGEKRIVSGIFLWPILSPVPKKENGFYISTGNNPAGIANPKQYIFMKRMLHGSIPHPKTMKEHYRKVFSQFLNTIIGLRYGLSVKTTILFFAYLLWKNFPGKRKSLENIYWRSLLKRKIFSEIFHELIDNFMPDFIGYYIAETDHFGHHFYKNFEMYLLRKNKKSSKQKYTFALHRIYRMVDEEIGKLLKRFKDCTIIIVSDHGMKRLKDTDVDVQTRIILRNLELEGKVEVWKQPSKMYLWPKNNAVPLELLTSLLEEVKIIETQEKVFHVEENSAGGITCALNPAIDYNKYKEKNIFFPKSNVSLPFDDVFKHHDSAWITGTHDMEGIFVMYGPNIRKGTNLDEEGDEISVLDIAPTILYSCNIPIPRDMDGKVIEKAFNSHFLKDHPIAYVESYEDNSIAKKYHDDEKTSEISDELVNQLKSLGYMD